MNIQKRLFREDNCITQLLNEACPDLINSYPFTKIEQYFSLFDQSVLPLLPLSIVFYHILELKDLNNDHSFAIPNYIPFF